MTNDIEHDARHLQTRKYPIADLARWYGLPVEMFTNQSRR